MGGGGTQGAGGGQVSGKAKKEAAEMFASMDLDEDGANRGSPYTGVTLERVIENAHFTAFPYQFALFNDPF
jgi:hypothetical protein